MKQKKATPSSDLAEVLESAAGRRFVWRLIDECGVFGDPYVKGDPIATARETGRKSWAINLFSEVMSEHFDLFQIMLREHSMDRDDKQKSVDINGESE